MFSFHGFWEFLSLFCVPPPPPPWSASRSTADRGNPQKGFLPLITAQCSASLSFCLLTILSKSEHLPPEGKFQFSCWPSWLDAPPWRNYIVFFSPGVPRRTIFQRLRKPPFNLFLFQKEFFFPVTTLFRCLH